MTVLKILSAIVMSMVFATAGVSFAAETKIVGSSTVSPFAAMAVKKSGLKGVMIEATGTSGGFSLFCTSNDPAFAPIALASRAMKTKERQRCAENGQGTIKAFDLGLSGVVLVQKRTVKPLNLTKRDIFMALAAEVPTQAEDCQLKPNTAGRWSDVRPDLPDWPIEVYGPPATSGTRASFIDMVLRKGATQIPCMAALKRKDRERFEAAASTLRADGRWIDAGENDSVITTAVARMSQTLGVIGYPSYRTQADSLSAAAIDGVFPTLATIANETYAVSRVLRVYAKQDALDTNPAARAFWTELTSEGAIGENGYLGARGLIPIPQDKF